MIQKYFPFYEYSLYSPPIVRKVPFSQIFFIPLEQTKKDIKTILGVLNSDNDFYLLNRLMESFPVPFKLNKIYPFETYISGDSGFYTRILEFIVKDLYMPSRDHEIRTQLMKYGLDLKNRTIDAKVAVYQYETVLNHVQILAGQNGSVATYLSKDGYLREDISKPFVDELQDVIGDSKPVIPRLDNLQYKEIDEVAPISPTHDGRYHIKKKFVSSLSDIDIQEVLVKYKKGSKEPIITQRKSNLENTLQVMLTSDQSQQKGVPCLTGLSGLGKSQIVKQIAEKNNWRFVDFRAAFLDRLDMEGMFYFVDKDNNPKNFDDKETFDKFSSHALFSDFVKVSDQYIEFATNMIHLLEKVKAGDEDYKEISDKFKEDGTLADIDKFIEKFESESRPALLFFDEIIRAKTKIQNLFTILLDSKQFESLTFKKAKIAAAANTPHGLVDLEEGMDLFVGQELGDPAIAERLKIIPVFPADATISFLTYIQQKDSKWNSFVVEYLKSDKGACYDMDFLNRSEISSEEKRNSNFPTFRAWEKVSDLLNFKAANSEYKLFELSIINLLGSGSHKTQAFLQYLKETIDFEFAEKSDLGYDVKEDNMSAILESNIEAGIPTGLFGISGIGKSCRIQEIADSKGYELVTFQMSQQSVSDIMGAPFMVDTGKYLLSNAFDGQEVEYDNNVGLKDLINEAFEDVTGLPKNVTKRAPSNEFKQTIDRCRALGKKLILSFDECNRISEGQESVQSAIFEAISDGRFVGVDFEPHELSVVISANVNVDYDVPRSKEDEVAETKLQEIYGEKPNYGGAKDIDSALRLRVASIDKNFLDNADAEHVRNYILTQEDKFHPIVRKMFKDISAEDIVLFMKSAEYKSCMYNVPSIRSFESFSAQVASSPGEWDGAWFFPSVQQIDAFKLATIEMDAHKLTEETLSIANAPETIKNWVGIYNEDKVTINFYGADTAKELMNLWSELIDLGNLEGDNAKIFVDLFNLVIEIEREIYGFRTAITESYIGSGIQDVVSVLINGINEKASNYEEITYEAISDRDTAKLYIKRALGKELDPLILISDWVKPAIEHLESVGKLDCIMYIVFAIFERADAVLSGKLVEKLVSDLPVFMENDKYFGTYNKELIKVVKESKQRSLGSKWTKVVDDFVKSEA